MEVLSPGSYNTHIPQSLGLMETDVVSQWESDTWSCLCFLLPNVKSSQAW